MKSVQRLGGQVVEAPAIARREFVAEAGEVQRIVADAAEPVFGLPDPPALDAEARPKRVMYRVAEKLLWRWRWHVRLCDGLAKEQPELRAGRAERRRWREREIELEAAWEHEDAVDAGASGKIEEHDRVVFCPKGTGPVAQDI